MNSSVWDVSAKGKQPLSSADSGGGNDFRSSGHSLEVLKVEPARFLVWDREQLRAPSGFWQGNSLHGEERKEQICGRKPRLKWGRAHLSPRDLLGIHVDSRADLQIGQQAKEKRPARQEVKLSHQGCLLVFKISEFSGLKRWESSMFLSSSVVLALLNLRTLLCSISSSTCFHRDQNLLLLY